MSDWDSGSDGQGRRRGGEGSWMVGLVLIALGIAFFLERNGVIVLVGNWWAIFIYLAALASFAAAWRSYRSRGSFGPAAGNGLTWGLVLTTVATIFLLDLAWSMWWPAIVIAVGVGIVAGSMLASATRGSGR